MLNDLRLGPDGKIYFIAKAGYPNAKYMGRINTPNNAGTACGFQDSVVTLAFDTTHIGKGNLGSMIVFPQYNLPLTITLDSITLSTTNMFSAYQWYKDGTIINGATNQHLLANGAGWYSVKVWNVNGCTDSAAYEITGGNGGTGVIDPATLQQQVRIYPNPVVDKVWLQSPVAVRTTLYDTRGRQLLQTGNVSEIDLRALSGGMYFLYIYDSSGNRIKTEKLVISRNN